MMMVRPVSHRSDASSRHGGHPLFFFFFSDTHFRLVISIAQSKKRLSFLGSNTTAGICGVFFFSSFVGLFRLFALIRATVDGVPHFLGCHRCRPENLNFITSATVFVWESEKDLPLGKTMVWIRFINAPWRFGGIFRFCLKFYLAAVDARVPVCHQSSWRTKQTIIIVIFTFSVFASIVSLKLETKVFGCELNGQFDAGPKYHFHQMKNNKN